MRIAAILFLASVIVGCNRQDTECLTRIGRKVSAHAKANTGDLGAKLDQALPRREPGLLEKVSDRLRYENSLTDARIEVLVKDREVELKGTVKTASQRQRAIELADTTAGVERVIDSINVKDGE